LEKLERLEIILLNIFTCNIFKPKINTCSNLGLSYEEGKGVKQDDFKALKFYQKACDLNDGSGCSLLGFMYEEGKGVKPTTARIQTTRLLVKLECLEIILFNAFAFFIHKSKIRASKMISKHSSFSKRRVI
jgi:hypothetical protein